MHRPFEADSAIDTLHKIVYEPAPLIQNFNPSLLEFAKDRSQVPGKRSSGTVSKHKRCSAGTEDLLQERSSGPDANRYLQRPLRGTDAGLLQQLCHTFEVANPSQIMRTLDNMRTYHHQGFVGDFGFTKKSTLEIKHTSGAVPLDSKFYIVRDTDGDFLQAIKRRDSIVLVKGARQMGKTSLLARGLQQARALVPQSYSLIFKKLNATHLESIDNFFLALSEMIYDQLDVDTEPEDSWSPRRGASINFERYIRRVVLKQIGGPLVWAMDEVDRLLTCPFGSEVFGLFPVVAQ